MTDTSSSTSDTTNKAESTNTGTSTTNPYAPTTNALSNIISGLTGLTTTTGTTDSQNGALSTIASNAANTTDYTPQATSLTNSLLSGGNTSANSGIASDAYNTYKNQLSGVANQDNDPTKTPGMSALLDTIRSDVGNSVNSQFAGAGRDLSGINQQSLARGISQGEAQTLLNQYNTNVSAQTGAAGSLYGAGNTTANTLQNLAQQGYTNQATGLNYGLNMNSVTNNGANNVLNAGTTARNYNVGNYSGLTSLLSSLAGLGSTTTANSSGTSSGTSNTTGTKEASPWDTLLKATGSAKNLFGGSSGGGSGG